MVWPITATPPAYMVGMRANAAHNNIFLAGNAVIIDIKAWAANGLTAAAGSTTFTGNYYVRSYYGTLVTSGTLTGATQLNLGSSLPCGWYRVHLTQGTNDATYGLAAGACHFSVVPVDARFPTITVALDAAKRGRFGDDNVMRGVIASNPDRYQCDDVTNSAFVAGTHAGRTLDANWYNWIADPVRPRPAMQLFTRGLQDSTQISGGIPMIQDLYDNYGVEWYDSYNEPNFNFNGTASATLTQGFYNTVKSARAGAKVMGPSAVNINSNLIGTDVTNSYWHKFCSAIAAMTPIPVDGISFHGYNSCTGDLSMGRRCFERLKGVLTQYGLHNLPRFHTEQGSFALNIGVLTHRQQAQWTMQLVLLQEQYNVPKEHFYCFYPVDTGDYGYPSEMTSGDCNAFPVATMFRTLSAELFGKAFTAMLDFGSPGNDMMLGSRYTNPNTGDQLLALQAAGSTDLTVHLWVTGASTLTVVDCFGNTSTVTVAGSGKASIPVGMEPVYVRVPNGATAVPVDMWSVNVLGADLASTTPAVASASGTSTNVSANAHRMVSGKQQSTYDANPNAGITRTNANAPYVDDTTGFPAWASLTWATFQTVNTVSVFCAPQWQVGGALLDFDVQWLDADGVTWHTDKTVTETVTDGGPTSSSANVVAHVSHAQQGNSYVENYTPGRWIFHIPLTSARTTKAIRLNIRSVTYGMNPTLTAYNAMGTGQRGPLGNVFMIRSLQAYNALPEPTAPPVVRYVVKGFG